MVHRFQPHRARASHGRLDDYDGGRHPLATARIQPPALGQWYTIRVVALSASIQASRNGVLFLEHRDALDRSG